MGSDKISVIVPIYNAGKYLERCLSSLSSQTYKNIEIVLIDDGSTDDSAVICKDFCLKDRRFVYAHQKNLGVSAARNYGISMSSGDYIGFCDSDDWVEPDMYESLYRIIKENCVDMACCAFFVDKGDSNQNVVDDNEVIVVQARNALCDIIFDGTHIGGVELWTKLIKREIFDGLKFRENIAIGEDAVMMFDVLLACNSIAYSKVYRYHYVYNEVSACNSKFKESFWTIQTSADIIYEKTKLHFPNNIYLADRLSLLSGLSIAEKLSNSKLLNSSKYKKIKDWIKPHYNKNSVKLLSRRRKISLKIFKLSRVIYNLYRKVVNSKFVRKLIEI